MHKEFKLNNDLFCILQKKLKLKQDFPLDFLNK